MKGNDMKYPNLTVKTKRLHKRIWKDKPSPWYWEQLKYTIKILLLQDIENK